MGTHHMSVWTPPAPFWYATHTAYTALLFCMQSAANRACPHKTQHAAAQCLQWPPGELQYELRANTLGYREGGA